MEAVRIRKENKYFLQADVEQAINEALRQEEPLIVSNEIKILKARGIKLILDGVEGYKTLKDSLTSKDTAKLRLKLVLSFDNSKVGQELKNVLKNDLNGFKYNSIMADWEDIERSGDISMAIDKAKERVNTILSVKKTIKEMKAAENLTECLKHIENSIDIPLIKTGFSKFDEVLGGGLRGGRLYAIGAISSLGKTTFALNVAGNIAVTGKDILIFSLEMGRYELMIKSISKETFRYCKMNNINSSNAKTALQISDNRKYTEYSQTEKDVLLKAIENYQILESEHIFISEGIGNIGVKQIRETIDNFKQLGHTAPVLIVDYMQILSPYNERFNDKQNIDRNITELKRISRDYNIPVIAISSFNRSNYLSDVSFESFKESGSIEYSADVLIGLQLKIDGRENWTESKPTLNEKRNAINAAKGKNPRNIELIILKNRMYKAWDKIDFSYYPQFDYFEETNKEFVAV